MRKLSVIMIGLLTVVLVACAAPAPKPAPTPAQKMLDENFQDLFKTLRLVQEELGQTPGFEHINLEFMLVPEMYVIATYTITEGIEVNRAYLKQRVSELVYQTFRNRPSRIEHKWLVHSTTELVE